MCPICGEEQETFEHVWICPGNLDIMNEIIKDSEIELYSWLYQYNVDDNFIKEVDLELAKYKLRSDNSNLTFIDIIKGFIPLNLYKKINQRLSKKETIDVLDKFRDHIFNKTRKEVWCPRTNFFNDIKKEYGI